MSSSSSPNVSASGPAGELNLSQELVPTGGIPRSLNDDLQFRAVQTLRTNVIASLDAGGNIVAHITPAASKAFRSYWGAIFTSGTIHNISVSASCAPETGYIYHLGLDRYSNAGKLWSDFRNMPVHDFVFSSSVTAPVLRLECSQFPFSREVLAGRGSSFSTTTLICDGKELEIGGHKVLASTVTKNLGSVGPEPVRIFIGAEGTANGGAALIKARIVFDIEFSVISPGFAGYSGA